MLSKKLFLNNGLLLTVAMTWGMTFSLQKKATLLVDPFFFNYTRFFAAAILMLFIVVYNGTKIKELFKKNLVINGAILGLILTFGNAFQQIGIEHTSIANSGFITATYVMCIPIILALMGKKTHSSHWLAAFITTIGLYILTGAKPINTQLGDVLQVFSAIFWALHIIFLGSRTKKFDLLKLNFWQVFFCGFFSLIISIIVGEKLVDQAILWQGLFIIIFSGAISMGLGLLFQGYAQRNLSVVNTSIILSMEGLFAALFGWVIVGERLTILTLFGGILITGAAIYSQVMDHLLEKKKK